MGRFLVARLIQAGIVAVTVGAMCFLLMRVLPGDAAMRIAAGRYGPVPHGHWKTLTFLAGLRRDSIVAPFVLDGPINGIAFTAWVRQCPVPTLKTGDVVILDNLGSHKGKPARDAIRDAGAHLFFLPPDSV